MLKPISIWDPNRQSSIDDIENNIDEVTEIVILSHVEATIDMISKDQRNQILNLSFRNNIPLYILVSGHENNPDIIQDIRLKNTVVIRWPLYWLTETLARHTWPFVHSENMKLGYDFYNPKQPNSYDFTFISLNKRPRYHRLLMMDALAKYDLIKNNAVTWREPHLGDSVNNLLYWKQEIITLDQTDESQLFIQERFPTQYEKSFMQLVPETEENIFFLTEKTATPIFFGKPFLVASCQDFHKKLQNFGFELYDELFDYSFDSISNMKIRFDLLAENIKRIDQVPKNHLPLLYEKVKEKIIHNRNHALKIACDTSKFPNIWHKVATNFDIQIPTMNPYSTLMRIKEFINR